jgi:hypothetical protein
MYLSKAWLWFRNIAFYRRNEMKEKIKQTATSLKKVVDIANQASDIASQASGLAQQVFDHLKKGEGKEQPADQKTSKENSEIELAGEARKSVASTVFDASGLTDPIQSLNFIVATYGNVRVIESEEKTKRVQIKADRDVRIEQVRAARETFLSYLDKSFDERKGNFTSYFRELDKAIEKGDTATVNSVLQGIQALAALSPFKDLTVLRESLRDPNTEFEV